MLYNKFTLQYALLRNDTSFFPTMSNILISVSKNHDSQSSQTLLILAATSCDMRRVE